MTGETALTLCEQKVKQNPLQTGKMPRACADGDQAEDQDKHTEELIFPDGVVAGEWNKWLHMVMALPLDDW